MQQRCEVDLLEDREERLELLARALELAAGALRVTRPVPVPGGRETPHRSRDGHRAALAVLDADIERGGSGSVLVAQQPPLGLPQRRAGARLRWGPLLVGHGSE